MRVSILKCVDNNMLSVVRLINIERYRSSCTESYRSATHNLTDLAAI